MGLETGLAIASLAATGAGTYQSFKEASKQRELMNKASADAAKAMEEARKKLDVNVYEQLAIPMQAYEREREALISSGAQAIQAGVESERGAAATAGRIQAAQTEAQAGQREAMAKELAGLQKLTAAEESRLMGLKADLDVSEAAANRLRERDAQRAAAAYTTAGFEGLTSLTGQALQMAPLYFKKKETATPEYMQSIQATTVETQPTQTELSPSTVSGMSEGEINDMLSKMTPEEKANFFKNFAQFFQNPFAIK